VENPAVRFRNFHDFDDFDEFTDSAGPADETGPRTRRRGRPGNVPEPDRFGRLTEAERERLAQRRDDQFDPAATPPSGDHWSSWDGAEHGPTPFPDWVVTEHRAVDTELGRLKTGKEADVYLVERTLPDTERRCLLAAKRYRSPEHRLFHRDAGYLEGRRVRRSREMRAMAGRTAYGRNLLAEQWATAEFGALSRLWSLGAPVPYPVQRLGTEVMQEFLGEPDGSAAARLAQLRPDPDQLEDLWRQLVAALGQLAGQGLAHGDLSAYNLLVHRDRLVLIDLPQVVDIVANPRGVEFLHRDVANITGWFRARGMDPATADPDALTATLVGMAH
jgi:RIO kinase 1